MLSWKEIVQNYIIKYSDQIQQTTRPLTDHFGIGYFTYHKIDAKGNYTVLVDRPEWAEHYVSNKIYLQDPYLRHPSVYKPGICLVDSHGTPEYKKMILRSGREVLGLDMAIMLAKPEGSHVEFFGFAGEHKNSRLHDLYLNHADLLNSFAMHFKQRLSPYLKKMEEEAGSLPALKGKDFFCGEPICPKIKSACRYEFLINIGHSKEVEKIKKLSLRERECLKHLLEEKTAKQTAEALGLKYRTIEFYFENIKNKLGALSKQELLKTARHLRSLGLL